MQNSRPSNRELHKRLNEAKESLENRPGIFANLSKAVGELYELNIDDANEIWGLIRLLLEEVSPKDYMGARPPLKSYEKCIVGHELIAFCWWSPRLEKKMYIKFALKDERYYYVSLHESRPKKQKDEIKDEMFTL